MTYFAYVSPKRFGPFNLPVPHQNKLLRARAIELGLGFGIGVGEVVLEDVFLGLFETVRNASEGDIVGCCSVQMLPSCEKLQHLCDIANEKKLHFDFLFEFTGVVRSPLEIISDIHWYNTIGRQDFMQA